MTCALTAVLGVNQHSTAETIPHPTNPVVPSMQAGQTVVAEELSVRLSGVRSRMEAQAPSSRSGRDGVTSSVFDLAIGHQLEFAVCTYSF